MGCKGVTRKVNLEIAFSTSKNGVSLYDYGRAFHYKTVLRNVAWVDATAQSSESNTKVG